MTRAQFTRFKIIFVGCIVGGLLLWNLPPWLFCTLMLIVWMGKWIMDLRNETESER